ALVSAVTGMTAAEAEETLKRLTPSSAPTQIRFWPFWVTRIPVFPWRVDLRFADGAAAMANKGDGK
ncbi:MAG: hypothetical protein NTZ05_22680, partial [Chloroflexi bacterium]|nr:hypothetical protein [Chloroflexota bacterium]